MFEQVKRWCTRPSLRGLMLVEHRWLERQLLGLRDRIDELKKAEPVEEPAEWCGYQLVGMGIDSAGVDSKAVSTGDAEYSRLFGEIADDEGASIVSVPRRLAMKKPFSCGEGCFASCNCQLLSFRPFLPLLPARVEFIVVTGPCQLVSVKLGTVECLGMGSRHSRGGGMSWALVGRMVEPGNVFEVTLERVCPPSRSR